MATDRAPEHHAISTEPTPPAQPRETRIPPRRLWFGFASSAISWVLLGCLDLLITWRACIYQEDYGLPAHNPAATALYLTASVILLAVTVAAGFTSYRNWKALADMRQGDPLTAIDRSVFLAVMGMLVSLTLGIGIILLALPPFFLDLCWRAR